MFFLKISGCVFIAIFSEFTRSKLLVPVFKLHATPRNNPSLTPV